MDKSELKQALIAELGSLPFKDKKRIKESENIPNDLLEQLILKNKKKKKITRIMIFVLVGLAIVSLFLNYFLKEEELAITLFAIILVGQIPQLVFHPDFKDNSKRELIFSLFKKMNSSNTP